MQFTSLYRSIFQSTIFFFEPFWSREFFAQDDMNILLRYQYSKLQAKQNTLKLAMHVAEKKIFVSHLLGFCQWHRTNKTPKMDQNFAAKMNFLYFFSGKGLDGHILSWLHVSF